MSAIKPLVLSMSILAFAAGAAYAQDTKKQGDTQAKPSMSQSGSSSAGASGSSSPAASGSASSGASTKRDSSSASSGASGSSRSGGQFDFDKADKNKDGQLSRSEFNEMMKGGASAGASTSGAGQTSAGQSGSSSAKTQSPSSSGAKTDDKPKTK